MLLRLIFSLSIIYFVVGDRYHPADKFEYGNEVFPTPNSNEDRDYWYGVGVDELTMGVAQSERNTNLAKNVILFLGDGFGFQTIMATRVYKGQAAGFSGEESLLSFEDFPNLGFSKTYNIDSQVPDSAGTGTAYLSGVKTNLGMLGYDFNVQRGQCETMSDEYSVSSIAKWSQDAGKRTGFVTTMRVTDSTTANIYAHVADKLWEVDSKLPADWETTCPDLKDIAAQLIDNDEGIALNVVMGGGFQAMTPDTVGTEDDPVSEYLAPRLDGRYLCDEWLATKLGASQQATLVRNRTQLMDVDTTQADYLMGIFANDNLPYEYLIRDNNYNVPTLTEMAETAINVLNKGDNGYFLLVEGGKIDWAHHEGMSNTALDEAFAFDAAIERTLELVDLENTLVIVTADHTHTMSIAGYPLRGNIITGVGYTASDGIPYTTMLYADGPGFNNAIVDGEVVRSDPTQVNATDFDYQQQSGVPKNLETHGGEDVPIHATGPWSHLFYTVHEQTFIANVMAYASCVGSGVDSHCDG